MRGVIDFGPQLLQGLLVTIKLTLGGGFLCFLLSFFGGLGKRSKFFFLRAITTSYIEIFRGTSALIQLFWFYFALPFFGVNFEAMTVGVLVLGLNGGAYGAEVVRGAIQSVSKGQYEAAKALNFSENQTLWRIIIPQAVVAMLPPMGNVMIELLKATALVSLITISELTFVGQILRADTLRTTEIFSLILVMYFIVALCITFFVRLLERRFAVGMDIGGLK